MSISENFGVYAAAFEKAFVSDDWSLVEPFFTEDANYEIDLDPPLGGTIEGRAAILAYFKESLDGFDRRFESRDLVLLDGPKEDGQSVWVRGCATYRAAGVPEFVLELEGNRLLRRETHLPIGGSLRTRNEAAASLLPERARPEAGNLRGRLARES